jgi:ATP-dependent Zn protease
MLKPKMKALLLIAALLLGAASSALAAASPTESYQVALTQIDSGKVTRATINRTTHDVKLVLSDGTSQLVVYPASDEATLSSTLHAHGATVKFTRHAKKTAAVHHHIRYIAGGVLILLIVVGGGLYIYSKRQGETLSSVQGPSAPPQEPQEPPATAEEQPQTNSEA